MAATTVGPAAHADEGTATFTLSAPATVPPNAAIDVTGSLTDAGVPQAGATVYWSYFCMEYPNSGPWDTETVTTADDGSFEFSVQPDQCSQARIAVRQDYIARQSDTHVDVSIPWKTSQLTMALDQAKVWVGDHVHGTATYTVDGLPVEGVAVRVVVLDNNYAGVVDVTETTDAQGQVPIDFDTQRVGWYQANASAGPTADAKSSHTSQEVGALAAQTDISMTVSSDTVTAKHPVTVSGAISREHGPIAGIPLHLTAEDYFAFSGGPRVYDTVTDEQGNYTFTDMPPIIPSTRYRVTYAGDGQLYPPATAGWMTVTVEPQHPTLTFTSDHLVYKAGAVAHLHISLDNTLSRRVVVTAYPSPASPSNDPGTVIFDGPVSDNGLSIDYPMTINAQIRAIAPGDYSQIQAEGELALEVPLSMKARALNPQRLTATGTAVFSSSRQPHPRFAATTTPARDVCQRFVVQRKTTGGWQPITHSSCQSASTRAVYRFRHHHAPGVRYRLRTRFDGDQVNLASHSRWVYFAFRPL